MSVIIPRVPGIEGRDCRTFTGYKPCRPGEDCTIQCRNDNPMGIRILIVNLDAMGDVLMTTAQLPAIKRAYPSSFLVWLTHANAVPLLAGNPYLDRVYAWNEDNRLVLSAQDFDLVLNADKSQHACAFVSQLNADEPRGFMLSRRGQVVPANPEAAYNYHLGLDDHMKFRVNQRTGQDILAETWLLDYARDEYVLELSAEEQDFCARKRAEWGLASRTVVAFNTGCSELYPNKKMTVAQHLRLLELLSGRDDIALMLLGGREDTARNAEIAEGARASGIELYSTPTDEGLRRGICYANLADAVISGDSFGMHLAIALQKHVFAWFGLSCWTEIDLYGRGAKYFQSDLACSPCWKQTCPHNLECIERIDLDAIARDVHAFADTRKKEIH